jgi:hypothetical protein
VVRLSVDGKEIPGNLVVLDEPGGEHQLEVWLGN